MVNDWKIDGNPALVLLHMQKGMVTKGSVHPERFKEVHKAVWESDMLGNVQSLLKAFRDKKLPVIFVSVFHNPLGVPTSYGWLLKNAGEPEKCAGVSDILKSPAVRDDLDVIPEMNRTPDEPILYNWFLGAFSNSGLDLVLKLKSVKTVVLAGFAAHSVVYHAAVQAVDLWYSVVIPRDASVSPAPDRKAYEAVMDIMAPSIALVTTTDDVIAHINQI